jgi:hypothetical protein
LKARANMGFFEAYEKLEKFHDKFSIESPTSKKLRCFQV